MTKTYTVWANVPDQDHIRHWTKVGECDNLEEYEQVMKKEIAFWRYTSNELRLQEPGSFKLEKKNDFL
jgi:hypothetical protein